MRSLVKSQTPDLVCFSFTEYNKTICLGEQWVMTLCNSFCN